MELHGASYSSFNTIYVLIQKKNRFRSFYFQNIKYIPVINKFNNLYIQSIKYKNKTINITNASRTFIECLNRIDLCGGWEECLKSLANLRKIKFSEIFEILKLYNNKSLEFKVGFVMELLSEKSPYYQHIKKQDLDVLKPSKTWIPIYINRDVKSRLVKKWGLYIPKDFQEILRGI